MKNMKNKCVFVIGPESTGSMLAAKICSHVLGIDSYGQWNGVAWSDRGHHKVCHRSLPYGTPPQYPDIQQWVAENQDSHELYFVLTTRDITISELSRFERWSRSFEESRKESEIACRILVDVISAGHRNMVWSYESFMFLGNSYLRSLYDFLDVASDFSPELVDANAAKVIRPHPAYVAYRRVSKALYSWRKSVFQPAGKSTN